MQRGLTDLQWIDYGAQLRRIHDRPVPPTLARSMIRESFRPNGADIVRGLDAQIGAGTRDEYDHPARQLVTCWLAHRATIRRLLARAEALGRQVGQAAPPLVLCHADIHTGNVMAGDDGRVWFVDWDETMLAPRERDLMFVVGGGISRALVSPQHEALFMQGYRRDAGPVRIDSLALAYYRYAWAVSDIGEFGDEVLSRPDLGPSDRTGGATLFCGLFAPGNIVEMALASDAGPAAP
jgi:spectinomycin phosphotransferase